MNFTTAYKVSSKKTDTNNNNKQGCWKGGVSMRIEAYNQVQQMYNTKKPAQAQKPANTSFTDQLQISSAGKDFQTAKAAVAASPDVREEVTAPIKAKIDAGTYQVSANSLAEKLLQKYDEMR